MGVVVSEAWFGFIGVVVGGLIPIGWQLAASVRDDLGKAVVAARLVDDDLQRQPDGSALSPDLWKEYRGALALVLTGAEWEAVADCYRVSNPGAEARASAQGALAPLVRNKRSAFFNRRRNLLR
jgi:hypothetical protein